MRKPTTKKPARAKKLVVEETPTVDDTLVVEETPTVDDTPVVDDTLVVEETPTVDDTPVVDDTLVVEESPTVDDAPVEEETTSKYADYESIRSLLTDPDLDPAAKLSELSNSAMLVIKSLCGSLTDFAETGTTGTPVVVAGNTYTLYNTIKSVLTTEDEEEFRVKMDIINLAFMTHGDEGDAFNPIALLRSDHMWSWGAKSLKTHQILVTVISKLAPLATREEALKTISFDNVAIRSGLDVNDAVIDRLVDYYS